MQISLSIEAHTLLMTKIQRRSVRKATKTATMQSRMKCLSNTLRRYMVRMSPAASKSPKLNLVKQIGSSRAAQMHTTMNRKAMALLSVRTIDCSGSINTLRLVRLFSRYVFSVKPSSSGMRSGPAMLKGIVSSFRS